MADETHTIRTINWREVFPFTNLFKAFRVAIHPSKLVLALAALFFIWLGGYCLDGLWVDKHLVQHTDPNYEIDPTERVMFDSAGVPKPRGIFITFFKLEVDAINNVVTAGTTLDPVFIFNTTKRFVYTNPAWLIQNHPLFFTFFAIWFLLIWSVFGGAISRIAAVHVARDEKISVRQAIRFSTNKLLSFAFAPLIPILILLVIGVVVAIGGLLLYIPYIGPIVLSLLFPLALIAGLVMALVLLGLVGGFNLMYPTIAVEGSDSFDAISRSFSYVFARPWRMAFYTLVAIVYGALTFLFVRFFIYLMLVLTHYFVSWWLRGEAQIYWPKIWPPPVQGALPYHASYDELKWSEDFAGGMISMWVHIVIGLLGAYAISFYFSANTIIYYLMRREVDATEMDDVSVEESEDEFGDAAPLAATDALSPAAAIPASATPATSAPGGGVTGTAGSADPGGATASQPYTPPATDAPTPDSTSSSTEDRPQA